MTEQDEQIADLKLRNHNLVEHNNDLLARARLAEGMLKAAETNLRAMLQVAEHFADRVAKLEK